MPPMRQATRATVLGSVAVASVALSAAAGTPAGGELPPTALGWPLLLHLERGGAIVAILAVLFIVVWRASKGELPTRFANIEYRVDGTAKSLDELRRRLEWLEFEATMRDDQPLEGGDDDA